MSKVSILAPLLGLLLGCSTPAPVARPASIDCRATCGFDGVATTELQDLLGQLKLVCTCK